jgi:hypothetical protein
MKRKSKMKPPTSTIHVRGVVFDAAGRHRRIIEPDHKVNLAGIKPLACDRRANVSLALMVRNEDLDRPAGHLAPGVLDRPACRDHRSWPPKVGIDAGLVVEDADPHHIIGDLRPRRLDAGNEQQGEDDRNYKPNVAHGRIRTMSDADPALR